MRERARLRAASWLLSGADLAAVLGSTFGEGEGDTSVWDDGTRRPDKMSSRLMSSSQAWTDTASSALAGLADTTALGGDGACTAVARWVHCGVLFILL
jgi:hypothetical protein